MIDRILLVKVKKKKPIHIVHFWYIKCQTWVYTNIVRFYNTQSKLTSYMFNNNI